jgi:hypothetical protein
MFAQISCEIPEDKLSKRMMLAVAISIWCVVMLVTFRIGLTKILKHAETTASIADNDLTTPDDFTIRFVITPPMYA